MRFHDFPAYQAFSYLAQKRVFTPHKKILNNVAVLLCLFSMLFATMAFRLPHQWMSHLKETSFLGFCLVSMMIFGVQTFFAMEIIDYITHRYIEHPNFLTRYSAQVRQNQQAHWFHHMIHYPGNAFFQKEEIFKRPQKGNIPRHWVFPLTCFILLTLVLHSFTISALMLILASLLHCKLSTLIHRAFHLKKHRFSETRYFQWLSHIHLLHHFDSKKNYMMFHPFMDMLFGTYLSPKHQYAFVKSLLESYHLTASDFINWHYLLTEATPTEYAISISSVKKCPQVFETLQAMIECLRQFREDQPFYQEAQDLLKKLILFFHEASITPV